MLAEPLIRARSSLPVLRFSRRWLALRPLRVLTEPSLREVHEGPRETVLHIDGLVCGACAARTERSLRAVEGIDDAIVDLASGRAWLRHERGAVSRAALGAALERVVVAPGARRLIASLARRARVLGRRAARACAASS